MSTQTTTTVETAKPEVVKEIILGKFPGAFGQFQGAAFTDLKAAGMDAKVAHKVAQDYGSDIGNAMRNGTEFGTKVAKAKKTGDARISLNGKGETQTSRTMSIIRLCQQTENLYNEGLVKSRHVDFDNMTKTLIEYFESCEQWVETVKFAD